MQASPATQQSAAIVQLSYSFAHAIGGLSTQLWAPPDPRQKPLQHWSPALQSVPFCSQGDGTQKARRLSAASSCPSR
jgi:hypothetical protein